MPRQDAVTPHPRRGLTEKYQAITRAARTVFGRDGYARTSIDVVAAEAGVSTRTVYNHFDGKEQLFSLVLQESATQVADTLTEIIQRHLPKVTDLERDLIAFGRAWATPMTDFYDHFAMVRQIKAEAAHFPQAVLDAWQEAGPRRVDRELARHLQRLADRGLLCIDDASRAATHFTLLVTTEVDSRTFYGAVPLDDSEITEIVSAGVRAFLNGYLPRSAGGCQSGC